MALSSAALLVLAFPDFNQPWCAWVALVPWLLLLRSCAPRAAFGWSWLVGFLFFLGSIWWLIHVTLIGWIILCAYLALYFGAFGWCVRLLVQGSRFKVQGKRSSLQPSAFSLQHLLLIPAAWVALEYLRSHFLTGLGWNLLAYSQTPWRQIIQVADVTGAWGVSFLIVLANVALAQATPWWRVLPLRDPAVRARPATIARVLRAGGGDPPSASPATTGFARSAWGTLAVAGLAVAAAVGYGAWRIPTLWYGLTRITPSPYGMARVALVQGNIPQAAKWDAAFQEEILARYESLTNLAAATRPDLIVWPETAVPGYLGVEEELTQRLMSLAQDAQRPLLVGSPIPVISPEVLSLQNSAILIDEGGNLVGRYDKLHLVPFGEFIPFERAFPWLRHVLPPIGDFVSGKEYAVFRAPHVPPFSVLICFEDVFPELARRFVQEGAQWLLVITNDAWFGPTAAAYQHAQASTFRAVELRVPIARAANTGWSGCIDPAGRWLGRVRDQDGRELFVAGTHTCEVPLSPAISVYRRWGDWFAWLCLIVVLGWVGRRWYNIKF